MMFAKLKNVAYVNWSLEIDCPNCEHEIDLYDFPDEDIGKWLFTNQWDKFHDYEVACPNCNMSFKLDGIEH